MRRRALYLMRCLLNGGRHCVICGKPLDAWGWCPTVRRERERGA